MNWWACYLRTAWFNWPSFSRMSPNLTVPSVIHQRPTPPRAVEMAGPQGSGRCIRYVHSLVETLKHAVLAVAELRRPPENGRSNMASCRAQIECGDQVGARGPASSRLH